MKTVIYISILIMTLLNSVQTFAETLDCNNAITQKDMNFCSKKDYEQAQAELNAVYQKASEHFPDKDTDTRFEESHKAWLNYRDLHCDYAADQYKGGSIRPLIYFACLETLTKERTWHIVNLFPEWD